MKALDTRAVVPAVLVLLGLICILALWRVLAVLPLHMPTDPNEGWNAYLAAAATGGRALYPGHEAYLVNNYPPLSFYIVGATGRVVGDNIVAGRLVSLLAFFSVCCGMALAACRMGAAPVPALIAPLLFAVGLLLFTDYVGMNDPQMLAHAVSVAGLVVLLSGERTPKRLAAAALIFVVAFFIKHNVVALPIAATLWLAFDDRKCAARFAGCGVAFGLLGLALFRLTYGVGLLSVVSTARLYSLVQLRDGLLGWMRFAAAPLAGLAFLIRLAPREPAVRLCAIYALVATGIGAVFLGGAGVDPNVLFDADIALALAAALLVNRLEGRSRAVVASALAAPLIVFGATDNEWRAATLQWDPVGEDAATAKADIGFIASRQGPALCEMLSFCYWAGKPAAVDFFNVGQAFDTGARSDAGLVREVEAARFAVIQFDPGEPYGLGENVYQALMRRYRLHHQDDYGSFYVPR